MWDFLMMPEWNAQQIWHSTVYHCQFILLSSLDPREKILQICVNNLCRNNISHHVWKPHRPRLGLWKNKSINEIKRKEQGKWERKRWEKRERMDGPLFDKYLEMWFCFHCWHQHKFVQRRPRCSAGAVFCETIWKRSRRW